MDQRGLRPDGVFHRCLVVGGAVQAAWLPVVGGKHVDAWAQPEIISQIFDFFDAHKTKVR